MCNNCKTTFEPRHRLFYLANHDRVPRGCHGDECHPYPGGYKGDWKYPLSSKTIAWYNGRMTLRRTSHAVYDTKYHLVWCPKYREDLFAQEYLRERAAELYHEKLYRLQRGADMLEIRVRLRRVFSEDEQTFKIPPFTLIEHFRLI